MLGYGYLGDFAGWRGRLFVIGGSFKVGKGGGGVGVGFWGFWSSLLLFYGFRLEGLNFCLL